MIVKIDRTFEKDMEAIPNSKIRFQIVFVIEDVKKAISIETIKNLKKLKGFKNHYRIRLGDYRAGLFIKDNTAEFIRLLHRKDIYKRFP